MLWTSWQVKKVLPSCKVKGVEMFRVYKRLVLVSWPSWWVRDRSRSARVTYWGLNPVNTGGGANRPT